MIIPAHSEVTRDFVVTVYIVNNEKVLLMHHKKLGMWLPPGGHIDPNELPTEAAIREAKEETGLDIDLAGEQTDYGPVVVLHHPKFLKLEDIKPGHQHIDLVYFGRMKDPKQKIVFNEHESNDLRWFSRDELDAVNTVDPTISIQAKKAMDELK